jgi:hypothetical protein
MLGDHALALARRGLAVFPCKPRAKEPATASGCKDATTGLGLIAHWWQQDPSFNIAIATGARSHIFVLDVDGIDAEAELKKLESECGALPPTIEAITARGRHLYFDWRGSRSVTRPAESDRVSIFAATAATCWRRHLCIRAGGLIAGASIVPPVSLTRRDGCWPKPTAAIATARQRRHRHGVI